MAQFKNNLVKNKYKHPFFTFGIKLMLVRRYAIKNILNTMHAGHLKRNWLSPENNILIDDIQLTVCQIDSFRKKIYKTIGTSVKYHEMVSWAEEENEMYNEWFFARSKDQWIN